MHHGCKGTAGLKFMFVRCQEIPVTQRPELWAIKHPAAESVDKQTNHCEKKMWSRKNSEIWKRRTWERFLKTIEKLI